MKAQPHERFSETMRLTPEGVSAFARAAGDTNPLHHDEVAAAASPFGRIIASGAHSFSLMLAVVPDYLKAWTPNVGLEASVRLLRPVHAGDRAQAEWEVTDIADAPKLKGWIVTVSGRLMRHDGVVALTGVSKSLIYWPSARPPPQRLAG